MLNENVVIKVADRMKITDQPTWRYGSYPDELNVIIKVLINEKAMQKGQCQRQREI